MKNKAVMVMILLAGVAAACSAQARDPMALGADVGTAATGAFIGSIAASFSAEVPLARAWSLDLEPSFSFGSGTGPSILQISAGALARFHLLSLFIDSPERPVQWGLFAAAGAVAPWARGQANSTVNVIAIGPAVRAGYRLVFGERGIFVEPSLGWMALFGAQLDSGGTSGTMNWGATVGMIAGWRF